MLRKIHILLMIMLIILAVGCSSKNGQLIDKYDNLYKQTVSMLDSEKVYESISDSTVKSNIKQMDELFTAIELEIPNDELTEYIALKGRHELIKGVIAKGLKWDTLEDLDKVILKEQINILKSSKNE